MSCPTSLLLTTDHVVFCYTTDLKEAAKTLAGILTCKLVTVTCKTKKDGGGVDGIDVNVPLTGKTAWLVGHGLSGSVNIGTATHSRWVDINEILSWCENAGYTHVVDSCCQPNLRRKELGKYKKLTYYCVPDDHDTGVITGLSLDTWWDNNKLYKV